MEVQYVDHMGSDISVVKAAKVSFSNDESVRFIPKETKPLVDIGKKRWQEYGYYVDNHVGDYVTQKDFNLIHFLAENGHWTPFGHISVTLRIKAPVFVARQLYKHKVGFVENEESRRYIKTDPEFWWPKLWREAPKGSIKQGSGEAIEDFEMISEINHHVDAAYSSCYNAYKYMVDVAGVCPEQARAVLPMGMFVNWYWTGSLAAYARVVSLRDKPDAQQETREIAVKIDVLLRDLFPVSWGALTRNDG